MEYAIWICEDSAFILYLAIAVNYELCIFVYV